MPILTIKADEVPPAELRLLRELSDGIIDLDSARKSSAVLRSVVVELYQQLATGHDVAFVSQESTVSPAGAAELLGVSRAYVAVLLKTGRLPSERVGTHHRITTRDVLSFKQSREALREAQSAGRTSGDVELVGCISSMQMRCTVG